MAVPAAHTAPLPARADVVVIGGGVIGVMSAWQLAKRGLSVVLCEKGRIAGYQIIAPTTWNFSPRDAKGIPGPVEAALEGAEVRDGETEPVAVQHIVRSFDPCMVCTVH